MTKIANHERSSNELKQNCLTLWQSSDTAAEWHTAKFNSHGEPYTISSLQGFWTRTGLTGHWSWFASFLHLVFF